MIRTFRFRLKNKNIGYLNQMANSVNFVWNYCNDVAIQYLDKKGKWLSDFDLHLLAKGCSIELGISAQTVQCVCKEWYFYFFCKNLDYITVY